MQDELDERLNDVLGKLYGSQATLDEQPELRQDFFAVYRDLLQDLDASGDVLDEEHAYLFSIPHHRMYRELLDEDTLAFIGRGMAYTLPDGATCTQRDIRALKEWIENRT